MGDRFSYAWKKLHAAALCLASDTGSLPERLRCAWFDGLEPLCADEHMPDRKLRAVLKKLRRRFVPAEADRLVVETLPVGEQQQVAEEIYSLYAAVCQRRFAR